MKTEKKPSRIEHGEEVHLCEPEQGSILGEDDDGDEMMKCLDQHEERLSVTSIEEGEYATFQTNYLCV